MRRTMGAATACAVAVICLAAAGQAWGASKTVCKMGNCQFNTIQAAINAASPGATITIGAGTYEENVLINKSLTLEGYGKKTVVEPAVSNPACAGGSLCGGTASNIILVEADNVTINNLVLEGDNPNLTSGTVVGGKDIDARNGIITNHEAPGGFFTGLTVSKVHVSDVYLRGIYESAKGAFNFNHDLITNVRGSEASIGMFSFEAAGEYVDNKVTLTNDAISANWSKGSKFIGNKITQSASGIHTDNNGGSGGVADTIEGNKVSECTTNGYGVWVFAPYVDATLKGNKVKGCAVGLAAFGSQVSGQGPTFIENAVDGTGAITSEPPTVGAYITTDLLGFGFGDVTATLTSNKIGNFGEGVFVTQSPGGQANVTAHKNIIHGNGHGATGEAGTSVEAQENWWGCPQGPGVGARCDKASGTVNFTPWLTAKP